MKIIFPYFRPPREASRRGTTSIDKSYKLLKLSKFQVQVEETINCNVPLGVKLILSSSQVCHCWSMLPFRVSSALRLFQCCLLVYTALVKFPMKKTISCDNFKIWNTANSYENFKVPLPRPLEISAAKVKKVYILKLKKKIFFTFEMTKEQLSLS